MTRAQLEQRIVREALVWYQKVRAMGSKVDERTQLIEPVVPGRALFRACDALAKLPARRVRYDEKQTGPRRE